MSKQSEFINTIAELAQAETKNRKRWVLPSVCIAQAALESGWNLKARTLFGIKGKGQNLSTSEYVNGQYIQVTAAFKAYPNLAASVSGYYDLITGARRYALAVNNHDYRSTITAIRDAGYATAPRERYINSIVQIIEKYDLTRFDPTPHPENAPEEVAPEEVNSEERTYTVKKGDSFWRISAIVYGTGTKYKELAKKNGMKYTDIIHPGDVLRY